MIATKLTDSTPLLQRGSDLSSPYKISLVGFSSFEKVTFESFFRLAARRPPGYTLIDELALADLAVVNADDPEVLRQAVATKPAPHVLLIGTQDGGSGWAIQKRPLNLMKVLAAVESMLSGGQNKATVPADLLPQALAATQRSAPQSSAKPAALTPVARTGPDSVMRRSVRTGIGSAMPTDSISLGDNFMNGAGKSIQPAPTSDVDHILVVDDSDIALKFMRNRLTRFGFQADLVHSGEDALARMNSKPYKFVFLDVMMEGLDGYQTCRAIKQRKYADGKPPVVVMLTSRGGTIDKIRGTLAGCDAYLTKPLNERELIAVLAKHDRTVARGFQETNVGDSSSGFARSH